MHLWLFDGVDGSRIDLTASGADPNGDPNPCLPPRQATFDPLGRTLTWLQSSPAGYTSRRLSDGHEVTVDHPRSHGLLWRAEPQALADWVVAYTVPTDTDGDGQLSFPRQQTSCACRWCNRFAMSMSFFGWDGDDFQFVLTNSSGTRFQVEAPAVALDDEVYALRQGQGEVSLRRRGGREIETPEGCRVVVVSGSESVLLLCPNESQLFWPADDRRVALADIIETGPDLAASVDNDGHIWIPVASRHGDRQRLGRLRMSDGRLERGPEITSLPGSIELGIATARTASGVVAIDVTQGVLYTATLSGEVEIRASMVMLSGPRYVVLAPSEGRWFEISFLPFLRTTTGCTLVPTTEQAGLEQGPWHTRCATP
jgi:hypothetical protein